MSRRSKGSDDVFELKQKVEDLQGENSRLKQRLDDLRKAKNNVITKREREVIQVKGPGLGRPPGVEVSKHKELEKKLQDALKEIEELKKTQSVEIEKLKKTHKAELLQFENSHAMEVDRLKEKYSGMDAAVQLEKDRANALVEKLRKQTERGDEVYKKYQDLLEKLEIKAMQEERKSVENTDRESHIAELVAENAELRSHAKDLQEELSIKEAKWLQTHDKLKQQVQEKWDKKYAKWMEETEKKIEELRKANLMLKSCLYKGNKKETGEGSGAKNDAPVEEAG